MTLSRLKPKLRVVGDEDLAMPSARSGLLRTEPSCTVSALREPAAIAGPSRSFIELTRNIELAEQAPRRFEPTVKAEGDIVL